MASRKRAICAGPGNPPAVVDETAHIENAARHIVDGGNGARRIVGSKDAPVRPVIVGIIDAVTV